MNVQHIIWIAVLAIIAVIIFLFFQRNEIQTQGTASEFPPVNYWQMFSGISLERKYIEEVDTYYRIPIFTSELMAHKGKEVMLNGYYLPYSRLDSVIIISRFPNANCFFCGRAGIESVAMVELNRNTPQYRTDQRLSVRGKLMLNATNFKKLAFVIADASVEKVD